MKFLINVLAIALMVSSCNSEVKSDGYVINGNAKGVYNGIRVYLKAIDQNNRQVEMDTAIVMNEKFTFEGKVVGPEMCLLYVNSVKGNLPLIVENSDITIDIDAEDLSTSKISGSKTNEGLLAYNTRLKELNDKRKELSLELRSINQPNESEKAAVLTKELTNVSNEMVNSPFEFIKTNGDNYYSLILLETMFRRKNSDLNKAMEAFNDLDESLKTSIKGKQIMALAEEAKMVIEAQANTEIGKIAPDFSALTPEGTSLSLNEIKGKVTLIDFWAAWCGPCRRENPNIVQVYNKYHDKGLEIIGVSLDGNGRQPDAKGAWIKAIEDDKLTWHHISNLQYFNGPIAKMYNIQSIPSSFILDADGKIVAKNLRGPDLEAKIAELLD